MVFIGEVAGCLDLLSNARRDSTITAISVTLDNDIYRLGGWLMLCFIPLILQIAGALAAFLHFELFRVSLVKIYLVKINFPALVIRN